MSDYRYKAFISYSHADEQSARWLHRALESYQAPAPLGLGKRPLQPVFRDRDELAASRHLSDTIREALGASHNLIVICSRFAANSRWVNEEVTEFIHLGLDQRIFCLFVDDLPPNECLPAVLRSDSGAEPLGADLRVDGRRNAKLKLIAGLLDIDYDALRQRDRSRRRIRTVQYAVASMLVVSVASLVTYRVATEPPCAGSENVFADAWNSERADVISATFISAGVPFSKQTVDVVVAGLSRYASQWIDMHREACEATMLRGDQSEQLMDLRMACLAERKQRFQALSRQFLDADRETVTNAVYATAGMGQLSMCADRVALQSAFPAAEGDMAATVAIQQSENARLRALVDSSAVVAANELAALLWSQVEPLDYPPLQAQTLVLLGRAQVLAGAGENAKSTFVRAASRAVAANDDELAAEAWLGIPGLVMEQVRGAAEARDVLGLADAYVGRLPDGHPLRARYHASLGEVLVIQGEITQGIRELQHAVVLARSGADMALPIYLRRLARLHATHLELESALPLVEESIELSARYFGENHPEYAAALQTLAGVYVDSGKAQDAIGYIQQSLLIEQDVYPQVHPKIAATYAQLGSAYFRSVQSEKAELALLRSLEIYSDAGEASPVALGDAHNNIGNLYSYLERFGESEYHLHEAARLWESVDFYQYSIVLNNLGSMLLGKEDYAGAKDYCLRALSADELQFPPDSPNIAYPLSCLGEALFNLAEYEQAVSYLRRAYDIRKDSITAPLPMAHTRINLAMALWELRGDREEIRDHYAYALNAVVEADTGDEAELRSWAEGKGL